MRPTPCPTRGCDSDEGRHGLPSWSTGRAGTASGGVAWLRAHRPGPRPRPARPRHHRPRPAPARAHCRPQPGLPTTARTIRGAERSSPWRPDRDEGARRGLVRGGAGGALRSPRPDGSRSGGVRPQGHDRPRTGMLSAICAVAGAGPGCRPTAKCGRRGSRSTPRYGGSQAVRVTVPSPTPWPNSIRKGGCRRRSGRGSAARPRGTGGSSPSRAGVGHARQDRGGVRVDLDGVLDHVAHAARVRVSEILGIARSSFSVAQPATVMTHPPRSSSPPARGRRRGLLTPPEGRPAFPHHVLREARRSRRRLQR